MPEARSRRASSSSRRPLPRPATRPRAKVRTVRPRQTPARPARARPGDTLVERLNLGAGLEVAHHRLPNGLVLLVAPHRRSRVISYQTWLRVGSRHEVKGQTGIAHLFEHLMFNETRHLKHGEF